MVELPNLKLKRNQLVLLLALAGLVLVMTGAIPLSIVSKYQGPKPTFYGIYYEGKFYRPGECYEASACIFDTSLEWDPDAKYSGMGNLAGEETTIFIPGERLTLPSWVPREMTNDLIYFRNPINVYEWEIKQGDTTRLFRMEEWVLKYFFTISYEWDSNEEAGLTTFFPKDRRYNGVEVWLRIDLDRSLWYFKGADQVIFGIAKIKVSDVKFSSYTPEQGDIKPVNVVRVNPASSGSVLPIYLRPGDMEYTSKEAIEYKGLELNPGVFPKSVYTRVILEDFGSRVVHKGLFSYETYGDVVTYELDVHVFVVGEWKVKDVQEIPDDYGRQSKIATGGLDLGLGLGPWGKLIATLAMVLIVLVALAIFMPGFLSLINSMLYRMSRRR